MDAFTGHVKNQQHQGVQAALRELLSEFSGPENLKKAKANSLDCDLAADQCSD